MPKAKAKVRRIYVKAKTRVKAAKPSIAIAAGLGVPAAIVVVGGPPNPVPIWSSSIQNKGNELFVRLKNTYLGTYGSPSIGTAITSTGTKAGIAGFFVHWIANITGANRYLARMKMPFRI
jgi:hypothetical protein